MAFHIRPDESTADGLRRLARKELASARNNLERTEQPSQDAIHEARKSVKKVRAIVEVVKTDKGHVLKGDRKRLRAVNRVLSRSRDADVLNETLSKLLDRRPALLSEHTRARLRLQLSSYRDAVAQAADRDDAWDDLVDELRDVRAHVKRWSPAHERFEVLARGLRATHKRGRKAMTRALESRRAADFHEWRKEMKALWYQLRLLEEAGQAIQRDVERLHDAEAWLGDDHNVVVLCAHISSTRSCALDAFDVQRFSRHAEQYEERLRRKAIARAGSIYRTGTRTYVRRIERTWKGWTRQSRAPAENEGGARPRRVPRLSMPRRPRT
jgi:CHAD domain-containing protein